MKVADQAAVTRMQEAAASAVAARPWRASGRGLHTKSIYPISFTFAALALYLVFIVIPSVGGLLFAFTDWSSYSTSIAFVGLRNFKAIFSSHEGYVTSIINTLVFTFYTTLLKTGIGFLLALALSERIVGRTIHRTILFIPAILSTLIIGILFKSILAPEEGLLNVFLGHVGLGALRMQWLTNFNTALPSVIAVDVWKGAGYVMTILLAGLAAIPKDYYEAASLDGASYWKRTVLITLPLMMRTITVTLVLNLIYALKVFDIIIVLTNGGPIDATAVLYTKVWDKMSLGLYGVATALSSVLFIIMVVVGFFTVRLLSKSDGEA
jgi:raffinose/stachyose/melibiose transport system permease protein